MRKIISLFSVFLISIAIFAGCSSGGGGGGAVPPVDKDKAEELAYQPAGDGTIFMSVADTGNYQIITIHQAKNAFGISWDDLVESGVLEIAQYYGFTLHGDGNVVVGGDDGSGFGTITFEVEGLEDGDTIWFKMLGEDSEGEAIYPWNSNPDIAEWVHTVEYSQLFAGEVALPPVGAVQPIPEGTEFSYSFYGPPGGYYEPVGDGNISFTLVAADDHYLLTINQAQNLFGLSWDDLAGAEIPQYYGFDLLTDPAIDFVAGTISFEIENVEDLTSIWFKILGVGSEGQTLYPWNSNEDIAEWVHEVNYASLLAGIVDLTAMTVSPVPGDMEFPYSFYGPPGGYYEPVGDGTIDFTIEAVDNHYLLTINQAQNLFGLNWFEISSASIPNYYGFELLADPVIDFVAGSISFEIDDVEDAESIWFKILGQNTDGGTLYPWNNNSDIAEWVHTVEYLTMLAGEVDLTDMDLNTLPEDTVFPYQLYSPPGGVYQQMGDGTIDFTIEAVDDHYLFTVTQAPNLYGLNWYDLVSVEFSQISGLTLLTDPVIDFVNGTISFEAEIQDGANAHFKLLGRNAEDNLLYPWSSNHLLAEWFEVINGGTFLSIVYDAPDIVPASTYNDVDPPIILETSPADGDVDVDPNASVTITWNEMPDPAEIADHITVEGDTFGVCQCNIWQDGAITRIYPLVDLAYGEIYTVTVDAETVDLAGNQLGVAEVFTFSTPDITVEQTRTPTWDNANMFFYSFTGNATETTYTVVNPEAGERWHVFQRLPVSVFATLTDEVNLHVIYRVRINGAAFSEAEAPEVAIQLKEIGNDYTIYSEQVVAWDGDVVIDLEQDPADLEAGISFLFGATVGTYEFATMEIQKIVVSN